MTGAMISNHFYPNSGAAEAHGGILSEQKVTSCLNSFVAGFKCFIGGGGNAISQLYSYILAPEV